MKNDMNRMTRPDIAAPLTNEELQDMTATLLPGENFARDMLPIVARELLAATARIAELEAERDAAVKREESLRQLCEAEHQLRMALETQRAKAEAKLDELGSETVKRLGIDVPTWAAEIRAKVATALDAPPQPSDPKPPAVSSEANPYEPDRQKRCNATRVDGDAFDLCNRTDNHHGDHMRLSYSGVVIKSWENAQCQHDGPCDAHPIDNAILRPLAYVDRKVPAPAASEPPREVWMSWTPGVTCFALAHPKRAEVELDVATSKANGRHADVRVAGPYVLTQPTVTDEERIRALTGSVSLCHLNSRQSWDVLLPFIATIRAEAEAKGRAAGLEEAATFVRLELSEDLGEDLEHGIRALAKGGGK